MHYMELGGGEMSLLGLLHTLDPQRVDVDLFLCSHQGELMKFIPSYVNVLPPIKSYANILTPVKAAIKAGELGVVARRLWAKRKHHNFIKKNKDNKADQTIFQFIWDCVIPHLPRINPQVEYDLCISYMNPHNIGATKVNAKRRLAWIHTDYSVVGVNAEQELPVWSAYDNIASISPDVTRTFCSVFPSLKPRIIEIENILPAEYIRMRAEEFDATAEFANSLGGGNCLIYR